MPVGPRHQRGHVQAGARIGRGIAEETGRLDALCNNAGLNIPKRRWADLDWESWDAVLDINIKGALNAMTFALAVEFARYGITANAVLPGWIETDMTENAISNEKFSVNVGKRIPARRWGLPNDFGGIAAYLLSDASSYHTGQLLQIDGGYWRF